MTWTHYTAELVDINGRKAHAAIDCDKHYPHAIVGRIGYYIQDGIVERPVWDAIKKNDKKGEQLLLNNINSQARTRGLRIVSEEFTEFSKTKGKS